MTYTIYRGLYPLVILKSNDGVVTHTTDRSFTWALGQKVAKVLDWVKKHELNWVVKQ